MPIPVLSVAQMREWEAATWANGQSEAEVIRRVGRVLATRLLSLTRPGDRILVLCGKGHNGDDARAALEGTAEPASHDWHPWHDRPTRLLNVTEPAGDAESLSAALALRPLWIVDALFGLGLNRPLSADWVELIEMVNTSGARILAVDVPSGLNAESGEHFGACLRADVTLTIGAPKTGLVAAGALDCVGNLEIATDVGLDSTWLANPPATPGPQCAFAAEFRGYPPPRPRNTHKGTYGHLAILAGSSGFHGAAVLAARAAQRAQPGLITVHAHEAVYQPIAAQLQAAMVSPWRVPPKLPGDYDAVLVGPGLAAPELRDGLSFTTRHLWCGAGCPVIVDASALDWVPLEAPARNALRVLTPHPGEAARMLRSNAARIEADRPAAVRSLSQRYGNAWVVLKGYHTLIGQSAGPLVMNLSGNPQLAQGGSGDLLAGLIAGFLTQAGLREDPLKLLSYAVWLHGAAADQLQLIGHGWTIEDLATQLGVARAG